AHGVGQHVHRQVGQAAGHAQVLGEPAGFGECRAQVGAQARVTAAARPALSTRSVGTERHALTYGEEGMARLDDLAGDLVTKDAPRWDHGVTALVRLD